MYGGLKILAVPGISWSPGLAWGNIAIFAICHHHTRMVVGPLVHWETPAAVELNSGADAIIGGSRPYFGASFSQLPRSSTVPGWRSGPAEVMSKLLALCLPGQA